MRLAVAVMAAIALMVAALSHAQTAADPQKCTLAGTVVDAITKQPLRDATVFARALPSEAPASTSLAENPAGLTDAGGRFSFENLAPGRYLVRASHPGYVNQAPGRSGFRSRLIRLSPGQHLDDAVVELTPEATISGHVFDAASKPIPGVKLQALRHSYRFGRSEFVEETTAVTDKAGEYRLAALPPGNYYLHAIPRQRTKKDSVAKTNYVPAYFPEPPGQSGSTPLGLRPGEQLAGVTLTLNPVHTVTISGRLVVPEHKLAAGAEELTLVEEGAVARWPYETAVDDKGNFEFAGIPQGNYVIMAERPALSEKEKEMWGQRTVQVADADVKNIEVALSPGAELTGKISLEGTANVGTSNYGRSVDLSRIVVTLDLRHDSTVAGFRPQVEAANVSAEGTFVFRDVPPGNYRLNFSPAPSGFYLKTARAPDILETGLTVTRGQLQQSIDLVLSSGTARVEGTALQDQRPSAGATVVLVPDSERRAQPSYYRQTITDNQGRFVLQDVVPGDYKLFAWQEIERGAYYDQDFLRQFEDQGKAVSLKEGASLNLQLEVVPAE